MFESEQKYIIKTADDIRRIQEGITQDLSPTENMKGMENSISKDSLNGDIASYRNLTIFEKAERVGGQRQLFWGLLAVMFPVCLVFEVHGMIFWFIILLSESVFHIFFSLYKLYFQKSINIDRLSLYVEVGILWIPILALIFGAFFWSLLIFWWGIFILWCCVTLAIEVKIRDTIGIYKSYLDELPQTHFGAIFDMSLDFYSPTIYPQQVIKIRDSIERVTAQIQQLLELQHRMSDYYQKWFATFWSVFFSKKLKEQMQSFFRNESNQLLIYVNTFSQDLNFWTERHKMELSQLEENIDQQREETILPEGKLALELSQDRISRLTQEAGMIRTVQK